MAQLAVAAAGAAIGSLAGPGVLALGLTGAQIGWMAGSFIGNSLFAETQKSYGPRLGDLTTMGSSYGTPIPISYGISKLAGQIVWASNKREIASTQRAGGKGGPPAQEYTTYTYEVDLLILLADNIAAGISRVWYNEKLVWTNREVDGFSSVAVSDQGNYWSRMTFYGGGPTQLPDPTYEAAVGATNACAYRGRSTLFIQGLQLGSSGAIPNISVELYSTATTLPGKVAYIFNFENINNPKVFIDSSRVPKSGTAYGVHARAAQILRQPAPGGNGVLYEPGSYSGWESGFYVYEIGSAYTLTNKNFCIEFWIYPEGDPTNKTCFTQGTSYSSNRFGVIIGADNNRNWYAYSTTTLTGYVTFAISTQVRADPVRWYHICLTRQGSTFKLYINGVLEGTGEGGGNPSGPIDMDTPYPHYILSNPSYPGAGMAGYVDMLRTTVNETRYYTNFDPPEGYDLYDDSPPTVVISDNVTVSQVVESLCTKAGLVSSQYDITALSSITKKVHCMNISQVTTIRNVLETLMYCYDFEVVYSSKLIFRPRNTAVSLTIPYNSIGYNNEQDPIVISKTNNLEIPPKLSLSYIDINNTYKIAVEYSDILTGKQDSVISLQAPIGLTRDEAKAIADREILKKHSEVLKTKVTLSLEYVKLEVNDIINVTDVSNRTYKMRIDRRVEYPSYLELDLVSVDSSIGATSTVYNDSAQVTTVTGYGTTKVFCLDTNILRDVDNYCGIYYGVYSYGSAISRSSVLSSVDNVNYLLENDLFNQSIVGSTLNALSTWTGGDITDLNNYLDVNILTYNGTLSSISREDMISDNTKNSALVGNEIIQFTTATLLSTGKYRLTGLLRARRNTSSSGHIIGEQFVLLDTSLRRKNYEISNIGTTYYYKAVSTNQKITETPYKTFVVSSTALKPWAPVNARANRDSTNTVITWNRRTRLSTTFNNFIVPIGELTESYELEIYTNSGFTTIKRTITGLTSPSYTYTSALQTTDFGANQSVLYIRVYQISSSVGRGDYLQATI